MILSVVALWALALLDIGRGWRSELFVHRELLVVAVGVSIVSVIALMVLGSAFAAHTSMTLATNPECPSPARSYIFSFGMEHSFSVVANCSIKSVD